MKSLAKKVGQNKKHTPLNTPRLPRQFPSLLALLAARPSLLFKMKIEDVAQKKKPWTRRRTQNVIPTPVSALSSLSSLPTSAKEERSMAPPPPPMPSYILDPSSTTMFSFAPTVS